MAYNNQYICTFNNNQENVVKIYLAKKDGPVVTPEELELSDFAELNDSTDEGTIITREATFTLNADDDSTITWETFLADAYDQWKATITVDAQYYFEGFLTPEEGNAAFLPKPYDIKLRATSGLKLLKDVALTDLDGDAFHGKFTAIEYIAAALQKTLLELPFRTYGSIYNEDMDDRGDDPAADYLAQIKFDHRTFMKDATTFMSCYDVLVAILGRHSRLFYQAGKWYIFYTPEYQYKPGGLWYTDYDNEGTAISGAQDTEDVASVGVIELIYPQDEDQLISSSFPIKYAKTIFNYKQWEELPLNNKFQRGSQISSGIMPDEDDEDNDSDTTELTTNTYKTYTLDDWTSGLYTATAPERNALPNFINPNPDPWYRRSIYNQYGFELRREVVIERATDSGGRAVQSEGIPVNAGDKIRVSFDWRTNVDLGDSDPVPVQLTPYIEADGTGNKYVLRSKDGQVSEAKWELSTPQMVGIYTTPNGDLTQWQSVTVESPVMPVSGTLYILMWASAQLGNNSKTYYRGLTVEYIPYVGGSYVPISGDFWQHTQNPGQIDKDEGETKISDAVIRVLKGCMFNADGVTATTPTWYRYGFPEVRHFKELVNLGRYNLGYRRFWRVEGTFCSLRYATHDNPEIQNPLSYHKTYRFMDLDQPRDFILVPPLRMDLCTGEIKPVFEEVYNPALTHEIGDRFDVVIQNLIAFVLAEFGLVLQRYPPDPRTLKLTAAAGQVISASASDNGEGNAPSFIVNTQFDEGGDRIAILTIGEDIEVGNQFTITVAGVPETYEVESMVVQADGTQIGDTQEFNYIFSN